MPEQHRTSRESSDGCARTRRSRLRPLALTLLLVTLGSLAETPAATTAIHDCRELRHAEPAVALLRCESAAEQLHGMNDHEQSFEAWMHAAELASQLGDPVRADAALDRAVVLLPNVEDALAAHRLARRRGLNAYRDGQPIEALARFLEALAAARAAGDRTALAISENDLGVTYRHLGNYPAALGHFEASLKPREAAGESELGALLANIGSLYLELGDPERAERYLRRALSDHRNHGRTLLEHRTLEELAKLAQQQDRPDEARKTLDHAWRYYVGAHSPRDQLRLALRRAELEAGDGRRATARQWLERARELAGQLQRQGSLQIELLAAELSSDPRERSQAFDSLREALAHDTGAEPARIVQAHLALADLAQGLSRLDDAVSHLREYQRLGTELQASRHGERFDALRVRFDVERLEAERDRLAADAARQEAELSRRRLETVLVAALALFALALLAFYSQSRQYRQRLRANAERAELERRIADSRRAAELLRSDLRSMAWLLDQQQAAALVFDAAGNIRAITAAAASELYVGIDQLHDMALAQALDPDLAHWAQALVETASLEGRPDGEDLGLRNVDGATGTSLVRCRRLALEEELGVLLFEPGPQRSPAPPPAAAATSIDEKSEASSDRTPFRHQLVALMRASLDAWERATRKTRIDLAEASGIWRITIDDGRLRVRAMDRYLSPDTVPDRPRWREVLRTAYFVLAEVPIETDQRRQLETMVDGVLRQSRGSA